MRRTTSSRAARSQTASLKSCTRCCKRCSSLCMSTCLGSLRGLHCLSLFFSRAFAHLALHSSRAALRPLCLQVQVIEVGDSSEDDERGPARAGSAAPSTDVPWWHRFPDFVPVEAMRWGTNPRCAAGAALLLRVIGLKVP